MNNSDEAKRLRVQDQSIVDSLSVLPNVLDVGSPCLVAQTMKLRVYPTSAQQYFACQPVALLGTESEGSEVTFTTRPSTFFALNLGGTVPPEGTNVIASFAGNRWVFRYDA